MSVEKIVIVTQKTRLEGLLDRFNTRAQAKFWIEHMGLEFGDYDREHDRYRRAVDDVHRAAARLERKLQLVDRALLPGFLFTPQDVVVPVGRDGLVANAAKYVGDCPIVAVNPDPARWDGALLPFSAATVGRGLDAVVRHGRSAEKRVTMAQVSMNDGQSLLAFNDFLIGRKDHVSARYALTWRGRREPQSSSGILVSTGVGSTGWLSSATQMAQSISRLLLPSAPALPAFRLGWEDPRLVFVVREPYRSRSSGVSIGAGVIEPGDSLVVESQMPEGGAIFSDGVAEDALEFHAGCVATVTAAAHHARLVVDPQAAPVVASKETRRNRCRLDGFGG